jgi:tRNA(Phe) wybutosine-synthesizing methylase Tyw3
MAIANGFRESGIVPSRTKIIVAIRTTASAMEVPLVIQAIRNPNFLTWFNVFWCSSFSYVLLHL